VEVRPGLYYVEINEAGDGLNLIARRKVVFGELDSAAPH
jgi:hypothetical protein